MQYVERQWYYIQCVECQRIFGTPRYYTSEENIQTLFCPYCKNSVSVENNIVANEINPIGVKINKKYEIELPK